MKKYIAIALLSGAFFTSCGEYNNVLKSTDPEYKYEAAKEYWKVRELNRKMKSPFFSNWHTVQIRNLYLFLQRKDIRLLPLNQI